MDTRKVTRYFRVLLIVLLASLASWPASAGWRQITNVPGWSQRTDHSLVVLDDKIWLLGGLCFTSVYTYFADVWYSSDGNNWSLATANAPWRPRQGQAAVAFDDKLWLIGGESGDVWYSPDGVAWTRATNAAPWLAGDFVSSAIVFDDKIWVIGGPRYRSTSVWYSSNGVDWTEPAGLPPWRARSEPSCVVFDGKIWIIGGTYYDIYDESAIVLNDVWSSSDGVNWDQATSAAPWPGGRHASVAHSGEIWFISNTTADVWHSSNGADWAQFPASVSRPYDLKINPVEYAGRVWVIGGQGFWSDVWSSSDGASWTSGGSPAPWGTRSQHTSVVHNGKLWLIGGEQGPRSVDWTNVWRTCDVWNTSDGENSTQVTSTAPWARRYGHASTVFNNEMWVLGGGANDVWHSADGIEWSVATSSAPWRARRNQAAVAHNGMLWVLGGKYMNGSYHSLNDVWYSPDGSSWTQATENAPWAARDEHACVSYDGKIWMVGGHVSTERYRGYVLDDIWYSVDGLTWTQAIEHAPWPSRGAHTLTVYNGSLWLLGGYHKTADTSDHEMLNDAWYSSDGANWTEADPNADWAPRGYHTAAAYDGKLWVMGGYATATGHFKDIWYAEDPRAFSFTTVPLGGWKEEGEGLTLSVGIQGAAGSVTYQWVKDGEALDGQTSSVLTIPSLQLSDQGYYWCIVTDESDSKTAHESPRAYVQVFPAGSLSGTSLPFIALAIVATIVVGALVVRHKRSQTEPPSTSQHK